MAGQFHNLFKEGEKTAAKLISMALRNISCFLADRKIDFYSIYPDKYVI
jgi:predicted HTH domain antitoxin